MNSTGREGALDFTESAVARLLRCQYDLIAMQNGRQVRQRLVAALAHAVDCDIALYLTVAPSRRSGKATCWPIALPIPPVTPELLRLHEQEHPLVRHLASHRAIRAWRLSDVDAAGRFGQTELHRIVYAALPARQQLAMRLASPDGDLHVAVLARSRPDFDEREQRGLEMLWLSLVQYLRLAHRARRSAAGVFAPGRARESRGIILLRDDLGVELCTEQARLWLAEYFPRFRSRYGMTLPPPVGEWVRRRLEGERIGRRIPVAVRDPFVQALGEHYLTLDLVVDHAKGEHLLSLAEEALAAPASSMACLGMTPREAEVLSWVAQGKSNPEIGLILGTSSRTVQKHLEHVFQKLGVESRTAATLRAWQACRYALLARP